MAAARRNHARRQHSHALQHQRRDPQILERIAAEIDQAVNAAQRTVYYTPSVTGKVIGYSTLEAEKPATTPATTSRTQRPTTTSKSSSTESPSSTSAPSSSAKNTASTSQQISSLTSSATSAPAKASKEADSKSGGLSPGASAGIAVVVILLVLGVAGVAFFLWRKKKRAQLAPPDEKLGAPGAGASKAIDVSEKGGAAGAAPPGTSHSNVSPFDDKHAASTSPTPHDTAAAAAVGIGAVAAAGSVMNSSTRKAPPPALNLAHAAPPSSLPAIENTRPISAVLNNRLLSTNLTPLPPPQPLKSPSASVRSDAYTDASNPRTPVVATAASAIGVAAGTAVGVTAGVAATAAANQGPAPPVHRVQMEFIPTMGDELELRVGQLVRVLHEYDDGWAQCVRLDRSEAGVCPRSCLSQRPVKPRPPPAGNRRPGAPIAVNTGRTSPNSGRPMSPPDQRAVSPAMSFHSAHEQARGPSPATNPRVSSGSTVSSLTASTPGAGYHKTAYRPNPEPSASPAPQITISQPAESGSSSSDAASSTGATGGVTNHKPSPLSNLTSSSEAIPLEPLSMPTGRQSPLARAPLPEMSATITSIVDENPFAAPPSPLPMPPALPEILRPASPVQRKPVGSGGPGTPARKEIPRKPVTPPAAANGESQGEAKKEDGGAQGVAAGMAM